MSWLKPPPTRTQAPTWTPDGSLLSKGEALRYATRRKTPDYAGAWKDPVSDQPSTAYIQKPLDDVPIQEVEVQTLQEVIRENDKI